MEQSTIQAEWSSGNDEGTGADTTTRPMKTSKIPHKKIREVQIKKVSRVFDIQKNNQVKNLFTGVLDTDMGACFNRSTWSPVVNMEQPPLGISHLILGDILVRVLQNLRTSWIVDHHSNGLWRRHDSPALSNGGADELRKIPSKRILIGTNNVSRSSDEEEAQSESMMVCLFTLAEI